MGKTPKGKKKSKTKSKKSTSKAKPKLMSMNLNSNNGAPEIENETMATIQQVKDEVKGIKLFRRAMKVRYTEVYEKQIRKAKRSLNKIKKTTDSQEEIQAAEATLQEAIDDLQDASQWLHPTETINQLNNILKFQIENDGNIDIIEETKNFIMDAEESEQLILKGKKEAMFFKIIEINSSSSDTNQEIDLVDENCVDEDDSITNADESSNEDECEEDNESVTENTDDNSTEDLMEIENQDDLQLPTIDPQQMNIEISKNTNFITPLKSQTKISDFIQHSNDGDSTPKRRTHETPINIMQEQLQNALKVLSPQEKMMKIRQQAKANAAASKKKIEEAQVQEKNRKLQNDSATCTKKAKVLSKKENGKSSKDNTHIMKHHNHDENSNNKINEDTESIHNENSEIEEDENEEECNDEEYVPDKMKQQKISIHRNYNTYFSVKLKIEKGGIATKQLLKSLQIFYNQLYQIDPDIAIYDYESIKPTQAILSSKNIPNDFSIMKTFFNKINVKPNGGHTWFQVWLGHSEPIENILINMKHWSSENDSYLYKKRLQEKFTAKDYWLLWSTERMDPEILKDEIDQLTMKIVNKKFQLSFNFGMIRKDTKFSNNTTPSKWNKAMIIEAKREEKDEAYRVLGRIFSTSNNIRVLGTEMRMIPVLNSDLPSHTKRKIARMTHKQEQFLSTLMIKPCVYLSDIDYYNSTLNTTLRNIIMNLETLRTFDAEGNPMKIFINVDYSNWHSAYVLTFPKHLEKEADDFITQLPAYLNYVYGEEVLFMLTAEGAVRANESKWDEENLCATSNLDLELDAIELESSAKAWLPKLQDDIVAFDTAQIEMQGKLHNRSTDADSVSTFASKKRHDTIILEPEHSPAKANENNEKQQNFNHNSNTSENNSTSEQSQISDSDPKSYQNSITEEEYSESSSVNSKEKDQKARKPSSQDTMNTSKSAVSDLEGAL